MIMGLSPVFDLSRWDTTYRLHSLLLQVFNTSLDQ